MINLDKENDKLPRSRVDDEASKQDSLAALSASLCLEIVDTINRATTLEALFQTAMDVAPISFASYHHFPPIGSFDFKPGGTFYGYNLPTFIEKYYKNFDMSKPDPGLVAIFAKGRFVWISDLPDDPIVANAGRSQALKSSIDLFGEALCIPLFGPNHRRGFMFMGGDLITKENGPYMPYQYQTLASLFHSRFCMMIQKIERQINLTPREAQVLELLTYGKTNQDIATILDISPSTVSGYLEAVFIKLDVSDRVSASMRAQTFKVVF